MIVLSIDKCNVDIRGAAELLGRIQTGKTSTYNDDVFHFYDTALFLVSPSIHVGAKHAKRKQP